MQFAIEAFLGRIDVERAIDDLCYLKGTLWSKQIATVLPNTQIFLQN